MSLLTDETLVISKPMVFNEHGSSKGHLRVTVILNSDYGHWHQKIKV